MPSDPNAEALTLLRIGDWIREAAAAHRAARALRDRCPNAETERLFAETLAERDDLLDLWPRLQGDQPL